MAALIIVLAVAQAAAGQTFKAPRTPWGDPDLQGTFTNSNEYATPLERPARFDRPPYRGHHARRDGEDSPGRRAAGDRRSGARPARSRLLVAREPESVEAGQPWSVVDPPDGRIPALTAEAKQRGAGPPRTSFAGGPFNGPAGSRLPRALHHAQHPRLDDSGDVRQQLSDRADAGLRGDHLRDHPRGARHPARPAPARRPWLRMHMGDARGHWEDDTLVVETTNFTKAAAYRGADPATFRVVERFTRVAADTIHGRRRWRIRRRGRGRGRSRCR